MMVAEVYQVTTSSVKSGIYEIRHIESGKRYIGSSKNMHKRLIFHKCTLNKNRHHNRHLQSAWNKYGGDSFSFSPILICDEKDMLFYEQKIIDGYKSYDSKVGYNLSLTADRPKFSPETIQRMKDSIAKAKKEGRIGGHFTPHTEESKQKMKASLLEAKKQGKLFGHRIPHTEESKRLMSEIRKGKPCFENRKPWDDEQKKKLSDSLKKYHQSEIGKQKAALKKKTHCKNGHELSGDNISMWKKGIHIERGCKICNRLRSRKFKEKKRLELKGVKS